MKLESTFQGVTGNARRCNQCFGIKQKDFQIEVGKGWRGNALFSTHAI